MHFRKEQYNEEIVFVSETDRFYFDTLWAIVKKAVNPSQICDVETTSWTQARTFKKYGLWYYFEEIYFSVPSVFSFRLFPFGKYEIEDVKRLHEIVELVEQNLQLILTQTPSS